MSLRETFSSSLRGARKQGRHVGHPQTPRAAGSSRRRAAAINAQPGNGAAGIRAQAPWRIHLQQERRCFPLKRKPEGGLGELSSPATTTEMLGLLPKSRMTIAQLTSRRRGQTTNDETARSGDRQGPRQPCRETWSSNACFKWGICWPKPVLRPTWERFLLHQHLRGELSWS